MKKACQLTYRAIHYRIYNLYGKPKKCEECNSENQKKYEWANLTGKYGLQRSEWKRLCTKCHRKLDEHSKKMWKTRDFNKQKIQIINILINILIKKIIKI